MPMPKANEAKAAKIKATNKLSEALALTTFTNSRGRPVEPNTAMMIPIVPIAISSRPKVTPPFAKLSTTMKGFSRISGLIKLSTISRLKANMADPAAENPDISANTTVAIGKTTRTRLIQS